MVTFTHNMDNDFFTTSPDQKQLLSNKVPYMIGHNDSEHSWLLPRMMHLPPIADEAIVLKFLAGPLIGAMGEEKAAAVAKQAYDGMVSVYNEKVCNDLSLNPLKLFSHLTRKLHRNFPCTFSSEQWQTRYLYLPISS